MKPPKRLESLIEEGLIDTVVRQLMSGKEANVYVVRKGNETLCAKIYKEATQRSFRQAVDYTENRRVKSTRQARAMARGTRFGRLPWRPAASGTVSGSLQLPRLLRTPGVWEGMLGAYWDKL